MTTDLTRDVYLYLFDEFSAETADVMTAFDITRARALRILKKLEDHDLVYREFWDHKRRGILAHARQKLPGIKSTWWANPTYDHITREEAIALYDLKMT